MLTLEETRAVLTVALMAAFSDGLKDDREREAVKRVADALGPDAGFDLPGLYRDVLLAKPDLAKVAAELRSPESRQLAYEMAVGVCDADGAQGPAEKTFLAKLAEALGLPAAAASATSARADEVADAAFAPTEAPAAAASAPVSGTVMGKANISDAEMDKVILNAAITNAALELLPESLASMAIIPLQMRLVYRIGKAHGYEMDRTHAKDFIATLGVGLTGQYLEQFGRKLLGGLLGGLGGGLGRSRRPASRKLRPDVRDDLRARPRRAALLRRGPHDRHGDAEADVCLAARRGARSGAALSRTDRAEGGHDRRAQPRIAGAAGLIG